jgi:hypothetical protein
MRCAAVSTMSALSIRKRPQNPWYRRRFFIQDKRLRLRPSCPSRGAEERDREVRKCAKRERQAKERRPASASLAASGSSETAVSLEA